MEHRNKKSGCSYSGDATSRDIMKHFEHTGGSSEVVHLSSTIRASCAKAPAAEAVPEASYAFIKHKRGHPHAYADSQTQTFA